MMATKTVIFEEHLHHVCMMHGLKQTYDRMPFLNKRVLEVRGKVMTIDNVVSPPPLMNYPGKRTSMIEPKNMVVVAYWKNIITVECNENMCRSEDITVFINNLIEDYLHFRHPFMKTVIEDGRCRERSSAHLIAEIM
jgi:hypothetical protein